VEEEEEEEEDGGGGGHDDDEDDDDRPDDDNDDDNHQRVRQVVLSVTQDPFFASNRLANFGDLGMAVKALLDDYQRKLQMNENIQSIEDMQRVLSK
jgi:hypothetical protein